MRVARSYTWLVGQRWFLTLVLVLAGLATLFTLRSLSITILFRSGGSTNASVC